jgi:hypothetical protein
VVLVGTTNENETYNLAPISSAFWLGDEGILMEGYPNRVDPDKWRPLIMSFQQFYGLGQQVHASELGRIPEALYRTPDIEEAVVY